MLIQYGQELGDYLYDVFVAKFDFWLAFGLIAQLLFTARFLVQWISSERAGKSVVPMAFWFFSMGGGLMTLVYGIAKREPVIILGQAMATIIYVRNIMLIIKSHARGSGEPAELIGCGGPPRRCLAAIRTNTIPVIANAAKQSGSPVHCAGLLRRFVPRNDGGAANLSLSARR